jgi:hypothetical protein
MFRIFNGLRETQEKKLKTVTIIITTNLNYPCYTEIVVETTAVILSHQLIVTYFVLIFAHKFLRRILTMEIERTESRVIEIVGLVDRGGKMEIFREKLHFAILTDSSWAIYVLSFSLLISQFLVCVLLLIKDISVRDNNRGIHRIQLLVVSPFILLMISAEMFKEFHDFWLYLCEVRKYNFKSKIGVMAVLFYTILYMCIILSMPIILTKAVLLVDVNNPFDILASFAGLVMLFKADTILYENLSLNETFVAVESGLPKSHKWKLLYTCIVIPTTVLALFAAMATYYVDIGDDL